MNEAELARNGALTEYAVQDLNKNPKLPYEDASFDVITNAVSVDYLSRPAEVFAEMHRVLKPGGVAVCCFSNRMFPTKAIAVWTGTGDEDHCRIVASYFHYFPEGGWEAARGRDITRRPLIGPSGDPMYVIWARKAQK
jgi:SAM-dependent methyltransferase